MKNKFIGTFLTCLSLGATAVSISACAGEPKVDPYSVDLSVDVSGTTIEFWTGFGTSIQPYLEEIVQGFEQDTGVKVKMESKGGYPGLKDAIVLAAGKKKYPNVALAYPDHFAEYVNADIIVRLDYYFEHDSEMGEIKGTRYDLSSPNEFYSQYMAENQSVEYKEDGTGWTLGVPFNKSTEVATYNKTFYDWAKTVDPEIVVPSTWGQAKVVGRKIQALINTMKDDGNKIVVSNKDRDTYERIANKNEVPAGYDIVLDFSASNLDEFRPFSYDSTANFFITQLKNWGSSYIEVDQTTRKGYLAFNDGENKAKTKAMLEFFKDMYDEGLIGIPATWSEQSYCSTPFKNLLSTFTIGSTAGADNSVAAGNKFEVGAAPVLSYESAPQGKKYVISQGTNLCLLDKGTEKQRVASWLLLKYLSKFANGEFAALTGYFPSCEYAQQSDDYQALLNRKEGRATSTEILDRDVARVNTNEYVVEANNWVKFVDEPFVGGTLLRENVKTILKSVFTSSQTIDDILIGFYQANSDYVRKG